jgi:hypothetical protein
MIIAKFALVVFLTALSWAMVNRAFPPAPVGGPWYYAEPPGGQWPLQPKWRLTAIQAYRSKHWIKATFDDRCLPLLAQHMQGRQELWRMVWLYDRSGRLRCRMWQDPKGRILSRQDLF